MLGVSAGLLGNNINNTSSVRGAAADGGAMVAEPQESGGTSGGSCGDIGAATAPGGIIFMSEEGDNKTSGGGGNRWPRQETLALLKIRSDMDLAFRDSSLKGPLWEQVSRKMAELGYHRNGKKCKEKFENVYKYHKRTKEGRSVKSDGKTYRFFDQLQALENIGGPPPTHQQPPPPLPPPPSALQLQSPSRSSPQTMAAAVTMAVPIQVVQATPSPPRIIASPNNQHQETVSSTPQNTTTVSFNNPFTSSFPQPSQSPHPQPPQPPTPIAGNAAVPASFLSTSPSSSSSTSSDEEIERRHKRKRKHKDFFESLIQTVVEKQEDLQKTFLETLEKRERDRMMREEAWRVQEMARLQNEHDLLVKERTIAAERESALISLLQKMTESHQQNPKRPNNTTGVSFTAAQVPEKPVPRTPNPPPSPPAVVMQSTSPPPLPPPHVVEPPSTKLAIITPQPIRAAVENSPRQENNGGLDAYNNSSSATSSRWPKAEIDALINLRTHLDNKYQENGPKGPLWEEISDEMKKLGYNRNSKRCKEKWENINKYYKKVKESNKKRPEDSKTCPYFYQLDALYREKEKSGKPEIPMLPIMAKPEQQWPFPQVVHHQQPQVVQFQPQHQHQHQHQHQQHQQQREHAMEEQEGENDNDDDEYDDEDEDGEDEEDDEDEGSAYEIVTNKQPSSVTSTA